MSDIARRIRFECLYHLRRFSTLAAAVAATALAGAVTIAAMESAGGVDSAAGQALGRLLDMMVAAGTLLGGALGTSFALRSQTPGFFQVRLSAPTGDTAYAYGQLAACAILVTGTLSLAAAGISAGLLIAGQLASPAAGIAPVAVALLGAVGASLTVTCLAFALATALGSAPWPYIFTTACFVVAAILGQLPAGAGPGVLLYADPLGIAFLTTVQDGLGVGGPTSFAGLGWGLQRSAWLVASLALVGLAVRIRSRRGGEPDTRILASAGAAEASRDGPGTGAGDGTRSPASRTLAQIAALWRMEVRRLGEDKALYGFALAGMAYAGGLLATTALLLDPPSYPTNASVIQALKTSLPPALILIAGFCGSELVWRRRLPGWAGVLDTYPVSNGATVIARALALICVLMLVVGFAAGAAFAGQALLGQYPPRLSAYATWLVAPLLVHALAWTAAVLLCHVMAPNRLIGWVFFGLIVAAPILAGALGVAPELATVGQSPMFPLGDMNGLGGYGDAQLLFGAYWLAGAAFALSLSALIWKRGRSHRSPRGLPGLRAVAPAAGVLVAALFVGWLGLGLLIDARLEAPSVDPQPSPAEADAPAGVAAPTSRLTVRSVAMQVDLEPAANSLKAKGSYRLRNQTADAVGFVDVVFPGRHVQVTEVSVPQGQTRASGAGKAYRITFDRPLEPGDEATLSFRSRLRQPRILGRGEAFEVLGNGASVLDTQFAPFLAGQLRPSSESAGPADGPARTLPDRDLVTTDILVTTPADQFPISAGKALSERVEGGRREVRYVSEGPVLQLIWVGSGAYAVASRATDEARFSLYYHPEHPANARRLLTALQESFESFARRFGGVPRTELRIVERGGGYGDVQSLANTVLMSERSSAFASDLRGPSDPDFPSLQVAHEVAHQWWGQEVPVADRPGAGLVMESVAQYAALTFVQRRDGRAAMTPYLSRMSRSYFRSGGSRPSEAPLSRSGAQDHLRYDKGGLALFLVADQIGESAMDELLRDLHQRRRAGPGRLATAGDLIAAIKAAAGPRQQPLIRDLLEDVIVYDLKADEMRSTPRADGRFDVVAQIQVARLRSGRPTPPGSYVGDVDVAAGATGGGRAEVRRFPLRVGSQTVRFVSATPAGWFTVDPNGLWLDPQPGNNVWRRR